MKKCICIINFLIVALLLLLTGCSNDEVIVSDTVDTTREVEISLDGIGLEEEEEDLMDSRFVKETVVQRLNDDYLLEVTLESEKKNVARTTPLGADIAYCFIARQVIKDASGKFLKYGKTVSGVATGSKSINLKFPEGYYYSVWIYSYNTSEEGDLPDGNKAFETAITRYSDGKECLVGYKQNALFISAKGEENDRIELDDLMLKRLSCKLNVEVSESSGKAISVGKVHKEPCISYDVMPNIDNVSTNWGFGFDRMGKDEILPPSFTPVGSNQFFAYLAPEGADQKYIVLENLVIDGENIEKKEISFATFSLISNHNYKMRIIAKKG